MSFLRGMFLVFPSSTLQASIFLVLHLPVVLTNSPDMKLHNNGLGIKDTSHPESCLEIGETRCETRSVNPKFVHAPRNLKAKNSLLVCCRFENCFPVILDCELGPRDVFTEVVSNMSSHAKDMERLVYAYVGICKIAGRENQSKQNRRAAQKTAEPKAPLSGTAWSLLHPFRHPFHSSIILRKSWNR